MKKLMLLFYYNNYYRNSCFIIVIFINITADHINMRLKYLDISFIKKFCNCAYLLLPLQLHPLDKLLDKIHNIYILSYLYHILLYDEIHRLSPLLQ